MTLTADARRSLVATAVALAVVAGCLVTRNLLADEPTDRLTLLETRADGVRVYHGSWHFPRGGPYMVGFESPRDGARLYIDGVAIVPRGRPVVREPWRGAVLEEAPRSERAPYMPGVVGVRFEAPPGARLLWIPPGRRSDPEYVPPSSLSPEPPATASFGSGAGARVGDGLFAVAIALTLATLLAFLLRRRLQAIDRRVALAAGAVLVAALAIRLVDLGGAGETWDENTNWSAGRNYITNLLSLDFSQASWRWNFEHPPVMKYVAGLGAQFADGYGPARALSALMGAIACALLVPIGRRLFSLEVGVLAGVIAALTPHLIGHGKIVGHEAPTVLWWTLALLLCLGAYDDLDPDERRDSRRLAWRFAVIGAVLGLAVFSRFANLLLAPFIGGVLLACAPAGLRGRVIGFGLLILPLVAIAVGFVLWPRLWVDPVGHLAESWDKLSRPHAAEPFLGQITNTPPRYYFVVYLVATAPLGVLLGAAAWLGRAALRRERASLVVALFIAAPLLIFLSPVRQDGVRYIMPALAGLSLAAAAGVDFVVGLARERQRLRLRNSLVGVLVAYLAVTCWRIHPYYIDYYGEQVGGTERAARTQSFEVAWWGEGLDRAIDYVNQHADEGARVWKGCISPFDHLGWLRGDLWANLAANAATADWIVVYQPSMRRGACPAPSSTSFSLVFQQRAQHSPVATVYRRAASAPSHPR